MMITPIHYFSGTSCFKHRSRDVDVLNWTSDFTYRHPTLILLLAVEETWLMINSGNSHPWLPYLVALLSLM